ncbi:hypothetical protein VTH06DRAFT_7620 [Thermothelomyces fergusii]
MVGSRLPTYSDIETRFKAVYHYQQNMYIWVGWGRRISVVNWVALHSGEMLTVLGREKRVWAQKKCMTEQNITPSSGTSAQYSPRMSSLADAISVVPLPFLKLCQRIRFWKCGAGK